MKYKIQRRLFNVCALFSLIQFRFYDKAPGILRGMIRKRNLHRMIANAYRIPFYKQRFDSVGITPKDIKTSEDLIKLPILHKDEYREWVESEIKKNDNSNLMCMQTSGSTGKPLKVINTPVEYARDVANVLRSWIYCGANPFFLKTLTDNDESSENVGYKTFVQRLGILRREMIDEDEDEVKIIDFINKYKPDILRLYKSEMVRIALYAEKKKIKMHKPRFYVVLGENVDMLAEKVLIRNYGSGLINIYGCVEAGVIAAKKPGEAFYELFDDAVAINIYNHQGQLSNSGRVMLTTLYKNRYPLINYDLNDIAEIERTNRGTIIKELYGRLDDNIVYSDGNSTGWIRLWHIVCKQEELLQIHMIQDTLDHVTIQCVKSTESKKTNIEIEDTLRRDLNKEIKGRLKIEFEWKDSIPLDANGKLKLIEKRF